MERCQRRAGAKKRTSGERTRGETGGGKHRESGLFTSDKKESLRRWWKLVFLNQVSVPGSVMNW